MRMIFSTPVTPTRDRLIEVAGLRDWTSNASIESELAAAGSVSIGQTSLPSEVYNSALRPGVHDVDDGKREVRPSATRLADLSSRSLPVLAGSSRS
jgi:hypothetical protein